MVIIGWNPLVNTEFIISGEYAYEGESIKTLAFESGKERVYLKNNFIQKEYPAVGLILDNTAVINDTAYDTEFRQFLKWFETDLRYGVYPFYAPRINFPRRQGLYQFTPGSLSFTGISIVEARFGLKEIG